MRPTEQVEAGLLGEADNIRPSLERAQIVKAVEAIRSTRPEKLDPPRVVCEPTEVMPSQAEDDDCADDPLRS